MLDDYIRGYIAGVQSVLDGMGNPFPLGNRLVSLGGEVIDGLEQTVGIPPIKKKRKKSKYSRELGRQMKRLNSKHRLKNGEYRKGWSRKRILSESHRATKRVLK